MKKRPTREIKQIILFVLREKPATYAQLERKVNTGYRTVKSICEDLAQYGQVEIKRIGKHPANGRPSYKVYLTNQGQESIRGLKK